MDTSKSFVMGVLSFCLLLSLPAFAASPNVIYGDDDRLDYYQVQNKSLRQMADATVALIRNSNTTANGGMTDIYTVPYGKSKGLCLEEAFYDQESAAFCSGFLVTPDTVITAGHCITTQTSCMNTKFVFDFKLTQANTPVRSVPSDRVYGCSQLIHSESFPDGSDFAVVKLDRAVTHVAPLSLNIKGQIQSGTSLVVMGYPSGLPLKIAGGAEVRTVKSDYFQANLDTFAGNSGSAVFNMQDGNIEGILVRGERDFENKNGCRVTYRCTSGGCRGEDVTRIDRVMPYLTP